MIRRLLPLLFLGFLAPLSLKALPLDSIGVTKHESSLHVRYLVSPGETIYGISTRYGVPISRLMDVNPELESGLRAGQVILVPYDGPVYEALEARRAEEASAESDPRVHVVQPGETLFGLSRQYKVDIGELLKWNGMELKVGQKLYVADPKKPVKAGDPVVEAPTKDPVKTEPETLIVSAPERAPVKRSESSESLTDVPLSVAPSEVYPYDPEYQQVLVIPFDPHLYFSDADDEIAGRSHIARTQVREVFRRRLNVLIDPKGYEVVYLLNGKQRDTLTDLNRVYSSVTYNYYDVLSSPYFQETGQHESDALDKGEKPKGFIARTKDKLSGNGQHDAHAIRELDKSDRYFGVQVKDPQFFTYFADKYSIDYYVFINQFEVVTDYEHCLDRATQNYARYFITHYSIFDVTGKQIAGNKFKVFYNSNSNDVMRIVADNMPKVAERIMKDLPPPKYFR